MKMTKRNLIISLAAVLTLSVSAFAMPPEHKKQLNNCADPVICFLDYGTQHSDKQHFKQKCNCPKKMAKIGLTDAQQTKIKAIRETNTIAMRKIRKDIQAKYKSLDKELAKNKYSNKVIKNLKKELKELTYKKAETCINERIEIRVIVTDEQYDKLFKEQTKYDVISERLSLTKEQQDKMQQLFETNKQTLYLLRQQMSEKRFALEQELAKGNSDKTTIDTLTNDISQLSQDIFKTTVDTKVQLKTILTFEQYENFIKKPQFPKDF